MSVEELVCPKCGSDNWIKDGIVKTKQRYFCKKCQLHFTLSNKGIDSNIKRKALILYIEGFGLREIGRMLNVSHVSVQNWVLALGDNLERIRSQNKPAILKSSEISTYIGSGKAKHLNMITGWLLMGIDDHLLITYWVQDAEKQVGSHNHLTDF